MRKIAGKHISIVLNANKTNLGEGIDIQVCSQPGEVCEEPQPKEFSIEDTK